MLNVKCKAKGFSVLETVIAMGIFVFIGLSIYLVYTSAFGLIRNSQIRIIATALATQQIEIARNLAYVNVGIEGVDIDGEIPNFQQISKGVFNFSVTTDIENVDDIFDGLAGADADGNPNDYKLVEVFVCCLNCDSFDGVQFNTVISSD